MANLASFDLNLLKVLRALLKTQSTTRAASVLGLSQPAVSASLKRLRGHLNDPLFVRSGRQMVPTDYCVTLAPQLESTLGQFEAILAGPADFDPALASFDFRVSGSDFFSELLMPRLISLLHSAAPGIKVQFVNLVPDAYVAPLDQNNLDLALLPETDFPEWTDFQQISQSEFLVVIRENHPVFATHAFPENAEFPLDLYCTLTHVAFSPDGRARTMGDAALARINRTRNVVMTLPNFFSVCRAVALSDNIAIVPHQFAQAFRATSGLRSFHAPMTLPRPKLYMVWHKRHSNNAQHCWMRDTLKSLMADVDADVGAPICKLPPAFASAP